MKILRIFTGIIFAAASIYGLLYITEGVMSRSSSLTGSISDVEEKDPQLPIEKKEKEEASILFVGDMMLDRNVYLLSERNGGSAYPFSAIENIFGEENIRVGNLEGPMTDNESLAAKNMGMTFTINPSFASELAKRFDVLSLANNHTLDFGEDGLWQTRKNLGDQGIAYFGDYLNRGDNISTIVEKNGIKIGIAGYHALSGKGLETTLIDIKKLRETTDIVVMMPHWGEEYETVHNKDQELLAKKFIAAGADVIVGGHPHAVQDIGIIEGKPVFWSLGNFIFDQYFSKETMEGLVLRMDFAKSNEGKIEVSTDLIPIAIGRDSRPFLMEGKKGSEMIDSISKRSNIPDEMKMMIDSKKFTFTVR